MRVLLPKSRKIRNPIAKYRRGDYSESYELDERGFSRKIEKDKVVLEWDIDNPTPRASYIIEWDW